MHTTQTLIRSALIISSFTMMSFSANAYEIGFCVTPAGAYGVIPCDLACVGSAAIDGASEATAKYSEYVGTLARATGTVAACSANTASGEAKINSKVVSTSTTLQSQLRTSTLDITDLIAGTAFTFEDSLRIGNKIKMDTSLSLENHISQVATKFLLTLLTSRDREREQSPTTTNALVENLSNTQRRVKTVEANKQRRLELYAMSLAQQNASKSSRVLSRAAEIDLNATRVEDSWNKSSTAFDIAPNKLHEIVVGMPKNIDLLSSILTIQNTINLENFMAANDRGTYELGQ